MNLFDHIRPREFNRDDVVVCHELGHTITWFSYGRTIGAMRFTRSSEDGLLGGGATFVNPSSLACRTDAEHLAERRLAGDSATRRRLNMRRDQISTVGVAVTRDTNIPALLRVANTNDDAMGAIWAAYETAKPNWYEPLLVRLGAEPKWYKWLRVRLDQARSIVDTNWEAIERIAQVLIPRLPDPGHSLNITAAELILLLEREIPERGSRNN